jgi:hypothetical protein
MKKEARKGRAMNLEPKRGAKNGSHTLEPTLEYYWLGVDLVRLVA